MKAALLLTVWLSSVACAADQFAQRLPLTVPPGGFAYRLALPEAVHRGVTRADFADLRVVNGAGETVPFGWASGARVEAAAPKAVALPLFPVPRSVAEAPGDFSLSVRREADGRIETLVRAAKPDAKESVAFWLIDASGATESWNALRFVWGDAAGLSAGVRVEAGDDLKTWRPLITGAPLIDLRFAGERLRRDRVEFPATRARYLRVHVDAGSGTVPAFTAVEAVPAGAAPEAPRGRVEIIGQRAPDKPDEVSFDLGGVWAVERAAFALPQVNTLAPAEVLVRDRPEEPWRPLTRGVVYRIASPGAPNGEATHPPFAFAPVVARYWLVRVDARSGGLGQGEVRLIAGTVPRHLVFVARGAGPFQLEYGRRTPAGEKPTGSAALPLSTLLPDYKPDAEWALPQASAGVPVIVNPGATDRTLATEFDARRATLWGLLIVAVAVLGGIAWRLLRNPA
jgi:hypothetical protein